MWRRWRRLPSPSVEVFPERAEAFEMACAMLAADAEVAARDIADALSKMGEGQKPSSWSKD